MIEQRSSRLASVLGATSVVVGNISGTGDLEIRGKVQGNIHVTGRILVSASGVILGDIEATTLEIAGQVRGDLRATDGVQIATSGQVIGQIHAPRVGIEAGAVVRGQLNTGRLEVESQAPPQAKTAKAKATATLHRSQVSPSQPNDLKPKTPLIVAPLALIETDNLPALDPTKLVQVLETERPAPEQVQPNDSHAPQESASAPTARKRRRKPRSRSISLESAEAAPRAPTPTLTPTPTPTPTPTSKPKPKASKAKAKAMEEPVRRAPIKDSFRPRPVAESAPRAPTAQHTKNRSTSSPEVSASPPKMPTFTKGAKGHRRT